MKQTKTILLVGSEGFLGRHLRDMLHSQGYDIIGIDMQKTLSSNYLRFIHKGIFDLEREDLSLLQEISSYGVIYTAGVSRNGMAAANPIDASHSTLTSLVKFLELLDARPPEWMVLTSTREVDILLGDEEELRAKQKIYSTLKHASELVIKSYHEHWDIPLKIFRLSDIFGVDDHPSKVMQIFFKKAILGEDITVNSSDVKLFLTEVHEVSSEISRHLESFQTSSNELIRVWDENYSLSLLELAHLALEFNKNSSSILLMQEPQELNYSVQSKMKPSHLKVLEGIQTKLTKELLH